MTISRAVASNSDAKSYANTWHGFAGCLAYRLSSVASHHVGEVVCGVCEGGVWCSAVRGVCCWGCGVCEGRYPSDASEPKKY